MFKVPPSSRKFIKSNRFVTLLFLIILFGIGLKLLLIQLDPDMWWHIRLGGEIIHGQWINNFTITCTDYTWINYSALTDVIFYLINSVFGILGLYILVAISTFSAALVSLNTVSLLQGKNLFKNKFVTTIFLTIFCFFITPMLAVRPQVFNILFLSILLNWLIRKQNAEVGKQKSEIRNPKSEVGSLKSEGKGNLLTSVFRPQLAFSVKEYIIWAFVFILWVNVHGGFISGLFLIGLFIFFNLYTLTTAIFFKNYAEIKVSFNRVKSLTILVFVILVVSVVNPFGIYLWKEIFTAVTSTLNTNYISEWQPISLKDFYMEIYFLFVGATVVLFAFNTKKRIISFLLLTVFGFLSFNSTRYMIIAIPLIVVVFLDELLNSKIYKFLVKEIDAEKRLKTFVKAAFGIFLMVFIAINIFGTVSFAVSLNSDFGSLVQNHKYPYFAGEFIKKDPEFDNKVIYNTYVWGGFLDYMYPERKWFIDGRMSAWSCSGKIYPFILQDAVLLYWVDHKWLDIVKAYNIEVFLIEKNSYLDNVLQYTAGWKEVYSDNLAVIYVKE